MNEKDFGHSHTTIFPPITMNYEYDMTKYYVYITTLDIIALSRKK